MVRRKTTSPSKTRIRTINGLQRRRALLNQVIECLERYESFLTESKSRKRPLKLPKAA